MEFPYKISWYEDLSSYDTLMHLVGTLVSYQNVKFISLPTTMGTQKDHHYRMLHQMLVLEFMHNKNMRLDSCKSLAKMKKSKVLAN